MNTNFYIFPTPKYLQINGTVLNGVKVHVISRKVNGHRRVPVNCGMDRAEICCGMVCKMRNAESQQT